MKRPPEVTYGRRRCGHVLRLSSCDSVSDACHLSHTRRDSAVLMK